MSSIYDIAKITGFSPSTVARALSGKGYCSEKTKKQVVKVAKELNYVPNQAAKTLKSNITNKVMLCIPDIMNPYYFGMINGATKVLSENNYDMILSYTDHNPEKELELLKKLQDNFVDGLIFGSFNYSDELVNHINNTGLPTVITSFYSNESPDSFYDCVYVDQERAMEMATEECIKNGHTEIAFIGGDPKEQNTKERLKGYLKALSKNNITFNNNLVISADFTRVGAYEKVDQFFKHGYKCTAFVACNDLMAVGCFNFCYEKGIKVPDDVSIVSLDNTDYSLCTNPPLTSVDMMQENIGENAASFLIDKIKNKNNYTYQKNLAFNPEIILRKSVKDIRTPARDILKF